MISLMYFILWGCNVFIEMLIFFGLYKYPVGNISLDILDMVTMLELALNMINFTALGNCYQVSNPRPSVSYQQNYCWTRSGIEPSWEAYCFWCWSKHLFFLSLMYTTTNFFEEVRLPVFGLWYIPPPSCIMCPLLYMHDACSKILLVTWSIGNSFSFPSAGKIVHDNGNLSYFWSNI